MATFLKDDQNTLVRDQNRFRKIYRYVRKKPRPLVCEGSNISNFTWGAYFVEFKHQAEVVHHFPCCYSNAPAVVATTVAKGTLPATAAKVSFLTFGEITSAVGYSSSDTIVGSINAAKLNDIEREWIDLKNADGSINRIKFNDGAAATPDHAPHADYLPSYSIPANKTTTVDISDVSHYGLGTTVSGGTAATVSFDFKNGPTNQVFYSNTNLNYSPPGKDAISEYLDNLWWDFSNKDGSVWRITVVGDAANDNYPALHTTNARSRTPDKIFNITVSVSSSPGTLGEWLTAFKTQLSTVTVDGSKFTDKWVVTSDNGAGTGTGAGSTAAKLTFTAATGNKGALANLSGPTPSHPEFFDTYVKARGGSEPDSIAFQSGSPNPSNGSGTESTTKGLVTKIIETVNADSNINTKWVASASTNSVERIDSSTGNNQYYETFVLTFTATDSNKGVISNITGDTGNADPNNFYYHFGDWLVRNGENVTPGAHFFSLTSASAYRNEKYPDADTSPDPVPVLTANGASTGGSGQPTVTSNPNHNVFVTDITTSQCTFRTSGYFTGYVYYQALVDGAYTMPNIGKSLEVKTLSFDGTNDFVTYNFTASFSCEPIVTVTADEDVNAFVTALSTSSVTIEVSKTGYQGKVYLQAIEKGC